LAPANKHESPEGTCGIARERERERERERGETFHRRTHRQGGRQKEGGGEGGGIPSNGSSNFPIGYTKTLSV